MTLNTTNNSTNVAWMVVDRQTGNSVFVSKSELKARIKCETINCKRNREATYVRPFDI